jgi:hypothetical protein
VVNRYPRDVLVHRQPLEPCLHRWIIPSRRPDYHIPREVPRHFGVIGVPALVLVRVVPQGDLVEGGDHHTRRAVGQAFRESPVIPSRIGIIRRQWDNQGN